MKLKCLSHDRRVLALPNSDSLHHRTGDMSKCDGRVALLVDNRSKTTRSYTVFATKHDPQLFELRETGCDRQTKRVALEDLTD